MKAHVRWGPLGLALVCLVVAAAAGLAANVDRVSSVREIRPVEQGLVTDPPLDEGDRNSAWLTTPDWRLLMTDFGYSDVFWERKPHWRRAWPWNWGWYWDEVLSGEWAAAIYYDQIPSPAIAQGPNAGAPQTMWLEPNFLYPTWGTNSNFWVVNPIQTWNRGQLPPQYLDTGSSTISNGQVKIQLFYTVVDTRTAMGRCTNWPWPWNSFVVSDRYVLQVTYQITNIANQVLTNLEFSQFLHGHPGTHEEYGFMGDWEVYDPNRKWQPWDLYDNFSYDITQWGRKYIYTWPWIWPWWNWWGMDYVGFGSSVAPSSHRSLSPWGLGDYNGHGNAKPARPGVHWDVEEHNFNPQGPACTLYPPTYPAWGRQVAGAENWYLDSTFIPNEQQVHEVVLSISNEPHHGWHWTYDWWYWYHVDWPFSVPVFSFMPHPMGWPWYYYRIGYWYWWHCYYYPRPAYPIWFGFAWPYGAKESGIEVAKVVARAHDGDGREVAREFVPDPAVTADLMQNWEWPGYEWYGFSLEGYELPDSTFEVEVLLEGEYQTDITQWAHAMIGDSEFGWSPDHYDSTIVEIFNPTAAPGQSAPAATLALAPSRPNPFNPATTLEYTLPANSPVTLEIYDLTGRFIVTLVDERQTQGRHSVEWTGCDARGVQVGSGVYVARLKACDQTVSQTLTLVK